MMIPFFLLTRCLLYNLSYLDWKKRILDMLKLSLNTKCQKSMILYLSNQLHDIFGKEDVTIDIDLYCNRVKIYGII